jgi:hypothetical protein
MHAKWPTHLILLYCGEHTSVLTLPELSTASIPFPHLPLHHNGLEKRVTIKDSSCRVSMDSKICVFVHNGVFWRCVSINRQSSSDTSQYISVSEIRLYTVAADVQKAPARGCLDFPHY